MNPGSSGRDDGPPQFPGADGPVDATASQRVIDGKYRVIRPLGEGGFGQVVCAEDLSLGREVAVKILSSTAFPASEETKGRFLREARATARLQHAHVVSLYEYGDDGGQLYLVLELVRGPTLGELIRQGPIAPAKALSLCGHVAQALAVAHDLGIVHRDIKPGNVLLAHEKYAKVADFGLARMTGESSLTQRGTVMGTASYMSPEQISGNAGAPTDIFALGCVLQECLTGKSPFAAATINETFGKTIAGKAPELPSWIGPDTPAIQEVLDRMLAREPTQRPTAADVARQLDELSRQVKVADSVATSRIDVDALQLGEQPTQSLSTPPPTPPKRRGLIAAVVLAVAVVAGGGALYLAQSGSNPATTTGTGEPTVEAGKESAAADPDSDVTSLDPESGEDTATDSPAPETLDGVPDLDTEDAVDETPPESTPATLTVRVVSSPPGATVRVDGRVVGVTPLEDLEIAADRTVLLERLGFSSVEAAVSASGWIEAELPAESPGAALAARLLSLPGDPTLDARLELAGLPEDRDGTVRVPVDTPLRFLLGAGRPAQAFFLYLGSDGTAQVFSPPTGSPPIPLTPGSLREASGLGITTAPPLGRDWFLLIATASPLTIDPVPGERAGERGSRLFLDEAADVLVDRLEARLKDVPYDLASVEVEIVGPTG